MDSTTSLIPGGPCCHCMRTASPCWRRGPSEKPILCNACGTRYSVKRSLDGYFPGRRAQNRSQMTGKDSPEDSALMVKFEPNRNGEDGKVDVMRFASEARRAIKKSRRRRKSLFSTVKHSPAARKQEGSGSDDFAETTDGSFWHEKYQVDDSAGTHKRKSEFYYPPFDCSFRKRSRKQPNPQPSHVF